MENERRDHWSPMTSCLVDLKIPICAGDDRKCCEDRWLSTRVNIPTTDSASVTFQGNGNCNVDLELPMPRGMEGVQSDATSISLHLVLPRLAEGAVRTQKGKKLVVSLEIPIGDPQTSDSPERCNATNKEERPEEVVLPLSDQGKRALRSTFFRLREWITFHFEDVMACMKDSLPKAFYEEIQADLNREKGSWKFLNRLRNGSVHQYNCFLNVLAAFKSPLFVDLTGREPKRNEIDYHIRPFREQLVKGIVSTKHNVDNGFDSQIDLLRQYIPLLVVPGRVISPRLYLSLPAQPGVDWPLGQREHNPTLTAEHIVGRFRRRPRYVHFQGRAGVGKTTLCQWLVRKWADGDWATHFKLIFLVPIRVLGLVPANFKLNALTLLNECCPFSTACPVFLRSWIEAHQENVLILIDGVDEISGFVEKYRSCPKVSDMSKETDAITIIVNLLRRCLLPRAALVVTSRSFTGLIQVQYDDLYEIVGLTMGSVMRYIDTFAVPEKNSLIKRALEKNSVFMSLCSIPVYCRMLCQALAEDDKLTHYKTYTRIHTFLLERYLMRASRAEPGVPDSRHNRLLVALGQLASRAYEASPLRTVFSGRDFDDAGFDQPLVEFLKETGVMILNCTTHDNGWPGRIQQGAFLHQSIQAHLGMACRSHQNAATLEAFVNDLLETTQDDMAILFLIGFLFDKDFGYICRVRRSTAGERMPVGYEDADLLGPIGNAIMLLCDQADGADAVTRLRLMVMANESQCEQIAWHAGMAVQFDGLVDLHHTPLIAIDILAVVYTVRNTAAITELVLDNCKMDESCADALETLKDSNLRSVSLKCNHLGPKAAASLGRLLGNLNSLRTLKLGYNEIGAKGVEGLVDGITTNRSVVKLNLPGNNISDEGIRLIEVALQHNTTLKRIHLGENMIGLGSTRYLKNILCTHSSLRMKLAHLDLDEATKASFTTRFGDQLKFVLSGLHKVELMRHYGPKTSESTTPEDVLAKPII